ncbi:MAG: ribonuclease E/G [Rhodospirillaceae bacterium]|nr:ribonuclease E/G [Rhodospirillaceae bacterium]
MKVEILLAQGRGESRGAVLTDGTLTDYRRATVAAPSLVGGIYRARIRKRIAGLAGAIGVIPGREVWLDLGRGAGDMREGAVVVVQIVQDAQGGKLARASLEIGVAGRFLAFRPGAAKPALSHRLADNDARAHLGAFLPKVGAPREGQFLAFHRAAAVPDDALRAEAERLLGRWRGAVGQPGDAPGELLAPADAAFDLLRVFVGAETVRIATDSEALAAAARAWCAAEAPEWQGMIEREPIGRTTLDSDAVKSPLDAALEPEIDLPGGGVLAIGTAAGLAAIDVDTDRAAGLSAKATFARVNREAAQEIGRQIRLRNLGGRIVVDFAGLGAGRDLPGALAILRKTVAADPMAVRIARPSEFGLVEMLRRRERSPLAEMIALG